MSRETVIRQTKPTEKKRINPKHMAKAAFQSALADLLFRFSFFSVFLCTPHGCHVNYRHKAQTFHEQNP